MFYVLYFIFTKSLFIGVIIYFSFQKRGVGITDTFFEGKYMQLSTV